jgi:hypothetical protein
MTDMSTLSTDFDQLCDDYRHGAMTEAEKTEFEELLKSDPQREAQWQEYLVLVNGVRNYGLMQMLERWYRETHDPKNDKVETNGSERTMFEEWKQQQKETGHQGQGLGGRPFPLFRFISAAAIIAVVFYVGWRLGSDVEPQVGHSEGFKEFATLTLPVIAIGEDPGSAGASEEKWSVTVQKNERPEYVAILANPELTLLLPLDQAPSNIRLRRLDDLGGQVVFLGIQDKWYRIRTDEKHEQILQEIKDQHILSRLK